MNARVYYIIHCIIGIAALAMLGYAFSQPIATLTNDNIQSTVDIYITKKCISRFENGNTESVCYDYSPMFKPRMQAMMGIVIALMICIFLEFIGMKFSNVINNVVSNVFGVLVLCLSIALIILVVDRSHYTIDSDTFKLTNTSIGILVVASLLVLYEMCCNNLIHSAVLTPYRMISGAGKKA